MAETDGEALTNVPISQSPLKRKSSVFPIEEGEDARKMKLKPDGQKEGTNLNGNADAKEEAALPAADKVKGKMVLVDEEGSDDEDNDHDEISEDSIDGILSGHDDSDFSDDPCAELDLDNILPSRTRRRRPMEPGAYLVEGKDGEDDDNDEDDEDDEDDDDGEEDVDGDDDDEVANK